MMINSFEEKNNLSDFKYAKNNDTAGCIRQSCTMFRVMTFRYGNTYHRCQFSEST